MADKRIDFKISVSEEFYRVGEPNCADGCCTPVYTADMEPIEGPLFYVETESKEELAAQLLGWSPEEMTIANTAVADNRKYGGE